MSDAGPSRSLPVVLLAAWLGAATFFAAVIAPAAFRVLPERALAGALVGRTLPVIFLAGVGAGTLVALLAWMDRDAVGRVPRVLGGALVALTCGVATWGALGRIERLRAAIGGTLDTLPPDDARRVMFGRLHALSVGLLGAAMLVAAITLVSFLRPRRSA